MLRMLESEEAARRLGVKVTTLYAYVSRGLLASHRSPNGRRSLFDVSEVERLARRSRQGKTVETRMATITTGITQLTDIGPIYRGQRAVDLAMSSSFEEVAELLWQAPAEGKPNGGGPPWSALAVGDPPEYGSSDRMLWAVVMAGGIDPLRADLRPESVVRTARRVAATMVRVLPAPAGRTVGTNPPDGGAGDAPPVRLLLANGGERSDSIAGRLALALSPGPTQDLVRGINAALVLLADHELATSTIAVRVAASTRADLYDALLAGLGTIAGPLHGGASQRAGSLLIDASRLGVERALNETLRWQGSLPGFGHPVYTDGDPRFTVLRHLFEHVARAEEVTMLQSLIELADEHDIPPPNVDLGLAAIVWATGMPPDAGQTIFTMARVAGWVAHYLEELGERPLRYRARAIYATAAGG